MFRRLVDIFIPDYTSSQRRYFCHIYVVQSHLFLDSLSVVQHLKKEFTLYREVINLFGVVFVFIFTRK
jgi:hypothetical protein